MGIWFPAKTPGDRLSEVSQFSTVHSTGQNSVPSEDGEPSVLDGQPINSRMHLNMGRSPVMALTLDHLRHRDGAMPNLAPNRVEKWEEFANPVASATSVSDKGDRNTSRSATDSLTSR